MPKPTDITRIAGVRLYFLPVQTRVPLKFGSETLTSVTCARVALDVEGVDGKSATGWGETPLSVQWVWPGTLPYGERHEALKAFCEQLAEAWAGVEQRGHAMEIGHAFIEHRLDELLERAGSSTSPSSTSPGTMPHLAALVCNSAFDLALHDAYGKLNGVPVYQTYTADYMNADLANYLQTAEGADVSFKRKYPADYFVQPQDKLPAWHLVGGLDPLEDDDLTGDEPDDGHPVLLGDWIDRDDLTCLKIKLRGNDAAWDLDRLRNVAAIARPRGVRYLTADFNCTVTDPAYVNTILDTLRDEHSDVFNPILYVEQPFPYDLEKHRIDVHSVSARKPLFMDESAHDWRLVRLGRELGWTGVALKTCKTQTGAILAACWAKAHGMTLMVQDLTNPMLAMIPHARLAAHVGTIMGVETNAMQFYPEASAPEAKVHPGLYQRRDGVIDLSTIQGPGFGYRLDEIARDLPPPMKSC